MIDRLAQAVLDAHGRVSDEVPPVRPTIVGICGPVSVGKSTLAGEVARRIRVGWPAGRWPIGEESAGGRSAGADREQRGPGRSVTVVSTDGYLYPNAVLADRGLLDRKGEPETFDTDGLHRLLQDLRSGVADLSVPVYSHEAYDVLGRPVPLVPAEIVILEGIVVLQEPFRELLDLGVYLDADPDDVREWFVERLIEMVDALPVDSTSILSVFRQFDAAGRREAAVTTWEVFNVPNNLRNIEPTRASADVVVTLGPDHGIVGVEGALP